VPRKVTYCGGCYHTLVEHLDPWRFLGCCRYPSCECPKFLHIYQTAFGRALRSVLESDD
jgi:hypothetical protein